jgi:glycosyltransferase involved in cell wall biosynthesis
VIANGARSSLHKRKVNLNQAKNSSVQLLYVGRLIKHKNCDFLVDVMELASHQRKNWKLTIIGIGPMEARLRELVRDKKLQECITFKSNVPEIELMNQYSKSDIFVFPSQREGYGISVAEALSHELPVIVYDCPENAATSLLQTKVSGLKIKKLEASVWIAAIEELLLNQDGNQLQNQVKIAKWESIANQYSEFLNSLMQSRNSSFEL